MWQKFKADSSTIQKKYLSLYLNGKKMAEHKKATTVDEQVEKLKSRGMIIDNDNKARENLLDIGYYRLGFYWFPFEETYPRKTRRAHCLKEGTNFDYAIKLYYFDFDLRNLFLRYISRIEVNFRTTVIYHVSNSYKENPYWYVDESIINKAVISSLEYEKALKDVNKEPLIIHDKKEHGKRDYAPAWKALEFMSFGTIIKLYENLINPHLKCDISKVYGMNSPSQFSNYINTVRRLRNCCAHEKVLFDLNLPAAIGDGPLGYLGCRKTMLAGAYFVFKYLLKQVSANRVTEMKADLLKAYERIPYPTVRNVVLNNSGLIINEI